MTAAKWHECRIAGFDTESTGTDVHNDRIVTAALVYRVPGQRPSSIQWLLHPGDAGIPDEAAAVHGWTVEKLEERLAGREALRIDGHGEEPLTRAGAIDQIAAKVGAVMHVDAPLVIANAPFDLTLLEAELVREGIDPLSARPAGIKGVVDPMVIDKAYDQYRKSCYKAPGCDVEASTHECGGCRGSRRHDCGGCGVTDRKLGSLCRHYGVILAGAHDASADALAAVRLSVRLAGLWPEIARWKLSTLHEHQVGWRAEQMASLAEFFRKIGQDEKAASCDSGWPLQRSLEVAGV